MSESERNEAETGRRSDEDALLVAIFEHDRASQTGLATVLGWVSPKGKPNKVKVNRCAKRLKGSKLLKDERGPLLLTDKGKEEAKRVRLKRDPAGARCG